LEGLLKVLSVYKKIKLDNLELITVQKTIVFCSKIPYLNVFLLMELIQKVNFKIIIIKVKIFLSKAVGLERISGLCLKENSIGIYGAKNCGL
jgi:hypothetical protein